MANSVLLYTLSLSILCISFFSTQAFAMGDAPSTCNNRYDGTITSLTITSDGQTYDPIANPDLTIKIDNDKSYSVEFTVHTPNQSSQGNSLDGTTWYHTSVLGYWMGSCVSNARPDQDISLASQFNHPSNMAPETTQNVAWATLASGEITYNIQWVNPTQSVSSPPADLVAKAASSSKINLSWSAPTNDGGSQVTSYIIERSSHNSAWSIITSTDSTSYSDTGLTRNTAYLYRVSAVNSVGTSEPSDTASAKTFLVGPLIGTIKLGKLNTPQPSLRISLGH